MSDPRLPGHAPRLRHVRLPGCVLPAALLVFMAFPLAELALLIGSARSIGFWWTLAACVATGVAGSAVARWQGSVVLRRAQEALSRGEFPGDQVLDGAMLLVGGVLLLTPGFLTDAMGLVLLLPPSRGLVKALLRRWWRARTGVIDVRPEA